MRRFLSVFVLAAALAITAVSARGFGSVAVEDGDKTLSPYFVVVTEDAEVDSFSLKETGADVDIAGAIADVTVTQVYKNGGEKPIECIYVFPASTRAAVYGMTMTIGDRVIKAKIDEREKARKDYEKAKSEGKSASLLEEERPNVFKMNVANIMPGDEIKVELKYTELLAPTDGVYEFVYPTVVGPRYSSQGEDEAPANDKWVKNPYTHEGVDPTYNFDITVDVSAGMPIQEVACETHKVNTSFDGPALATVKLDPSENKGGNKDFILNYRLAGGKIESGLLLYEGKDENFFLLMMQPPERVKPKAIPPREYIFIVDVSGSMHGFPLDVSKKLLRDLIGNLRPTDKFNVLLFAGGNTVMSEKSLPATEENINKAIGVIDRQTGGGGTELLPALKRALALPGIGEVSRSVVIVTDGYVSVEKEAFDLIRDNLGEANMFTFGIGSSVNRYLLEGMARVGQGEPFIVTGPDEAKPRAKKFRELIQTPVLTNIKVDFGDLTVYDVDPKSVPDVLAERPVIVYGKYKGKPRGEITLTGMTGDGKYKAKVDVGEAEPMKTNSAIRYLWARNRIALLDDYNKVDNSDKRVKEVTKLGLKYNLLTAYTSFIAIDSQVRNKDGDPTTVNQPLPMPEGVSDYSVSSPSMYSRGGGLMKRSMDKAKPSVAPAPPVKPLPEETESGADEKDKENGGIVFAKVKVSGHLTRGQANSALENNRTAIEKCVNKALAANSGLSGEITVQLAVDASGSVTGVKVLLDSAGDSGLEQCLVKALEKVTFPAAGAGKQSIVTVTIKI